MSETQRVTRRRALAAGAAALGGLAGCLGFGSQPSDAPSGNGNGPDLPTPYLGADSREAADAVIAVWSDFRCPHCADFHESTLPQIRQQLIGDGVRYEHHDYVLPIDQWSRKVAMAARSVQERSGMETFWAFTERAFAQQTAMDDLSTVRTVAENAGADPETVAEDVQNERHAAVIEADKQAGEDAGVGGTPAVFVDGESVRNNYPAIAAAVDAVR